MYFLARLEETGFSIWLRESAWGFFTALTLHSLSLALVIGINLVIALRVLGVARQVPLNLMSRFLPLMWLGLLIVVITGGLLLTAYPAKALTNLVFYLKLGCIISGLLVTRYFATHLMRGSTGKLVSGNRNHRILASLAVGLWLTSVGAGRFLAYTHSILLASSFY